ncbi:Serpin family protein [Dioscorea alata]|uniref:Serpin family protein n=1 Tax=Dioscorea alata TaxID=55571 RepID=A0ACB7WQW1_DIOAL|nr:Serpin family protein [Dioscorea alata]
MADQCMLVGEKEGVEAATEGSNFIYSPMSIRAALSLAALGAKGETLNQMLSFLGYDTFANLKAASARLVHVIKPSDSDHESGPELSFVNGIWFDQSKFLMPEFVQVATSVYKAFTECVDFNQPDKVTKEVNDWVEKETNGKIKDLIPINSMRPLDQVILCNALHFKGAWQHKFDKSQTRDHTFHLLNGNTIQTPFMTTILDQFITSFSGFSVLRLPFRQNRDFSRSFSMHIILPNDTTGFIPLMQRISIEPNFISQHTPKMQMSVGMFMVPKFKVSFGFEASQVLKDLGMELPFDGNADFTGMALGLDGRCDLFFHRVHHKASIEVDEDGAEADAATAVVFQMQCCRRPVNFVADHPFMFAVVEDLSGAVLFLGHVVNPLNV